MSIRFLKLSLASPESIRSWTERILPNGKRVGKILKGDLIDYKNGLPIRDGLSCERIFGPMVSFTCTCGRFKCIETRGIHIVHDTLRSSRPIFPDVSHQNDSLGVKGELKSAFQTFPNSTKLEIETKVSPIISQNTISKPVKKLIYNEKPTKKLKSTESFESSILKPPGGSGGAVTYRQKKMIRFLSDFYYDYESIYHFSKNQIIPSFVSIFEKPYNITLPTRNFFKRQTVRYYSKKRQIFKPLRNSSSNFYFSIANKQMVGLSIRSSIIYHLLKPLYKFIFQIYMGFWFDLKIHYNNFLYEKYIFLWAPHQRLEGSKFCHDLVVHSSFFNKFKIQGLYNKSQTLPIISGIIPYETTFLRGRAAGLKYLKRVAQRQKCFSFTSIPLSLVLKKTNGYSFFRRATITPKSTDNYFHVSKLLYIRSFFENSKYLYIKPKKNFEWSPSEWSPSEWSPSGWSPRGIKLLQFNKEDPLCQSFTKEIKYKKKTFFYFNWLKPKGVAQREKIELPYVFQFFVKLKFKKNGRATAKTKKEKSIIILYFAKQAKFNHRIVSCGLLFIKKNLINDINQKFDLQLNLFEKNVSTKNIPKEIVLSLMQKPIVLENLRNGKIANISVGSLKISSFDLKQGFSNSFSKFSSLFKKWNLNSKSKTLMLFQSNKKLSKPISIFDFFEKQEKKMLLCRSKHHHLGSAYLLKGSHAIPRQAMGWNRADSSLNFDQKKLISNSSWSKLPQNGKTFSKGRAAAKSKIDNTTHIPATSPTNNEDVSKLYTNTKQNIRVYKFKNFPPEEIRYCPYCEVELLPNSIRRYRLGYIEFISPVTHIWYTANSIPLLLNLSKTMIEGIASCHEALSSGFPPVYKWSYNGESPTSWTFQMQPLKLPINSIPKVLFSSPYIIKKSYFKEISQPVDMSNSDIKFVFPAGSTQVSYFQEKPKTAKPWGRKIGWQGYKKSFRAWLPSFQIISRELTLSSPGSLKQGHFPVFFKKAWKKNFTICQKRIKNPFIKNVKTNYKAKVNKSKIEKFLDNYNLRLLNPHINTILKNSNLNDSFSFSKKKADSNFGIFQNQNGKSRQLPLDSASVFLTFKKTDASVFGGPREAPFTGANRNLFLNTEADSGFRFSENQNRESKDFNPLDSAPKKTLKRYPFEINSSYLSSWKDISYKFKCLWMFEYYSGKSLLKNNYFVPISNKALSTFTNDLEKQEKTDTVHTKQYLKTALFEGVAQRDNVSIILNPNHSNNDIFLNQKKIAKSFFFNNLLKYNGSSNFIPITKSYLDQSSSIFNFPKKLFFDNKKINFQSTRWLNHQKKLKIIINNQQISTVNLLNENETMYRFLFFNQIPLKKKNLSYDLYTATEDEKRREWLKLEGFLEDPSNQKLPNKDQDQEENSLQQKHLMSWNENKKKNENNYNTFDNQSLPLVLPFLGKNPDNIEFQSNYSNHEHFHIDPLKFMIDLFSTEHLWGYNNFNSNDDQNFHKHSWFVNTNKKRSRFDCLETNENPNLKIFMEKKQNNDIWNHEPIVDKNFIASFSNKYMPVILNINQNVQKKKKFIKSRYLLKKNPQANVLFSLFSPYKNSEETNFWSSLSSFYIVAHNLLSKTYPFLPHNSKILKGSRIGSKDSKNDSLQEQYSHLIPIKYLSNDLNFTNYHQNYESCFRKLGRNAYYFKLEQMSRSENGFLKNLFFRNIFQKTSIFKSNFLMVSFISPSIFYSHCATPENNTAGPQINSLEFSNKIRFVSPYLSNSEEINKAEKINQNSMIMKKTRFLFGFHLSVCSFNFFGSHLAEMKYLPYFLEKRNKFFLSLMKNELFSFTYNKKIISLNNKERIEIFPLRDPSKKNFKNSLWPLKSNVKNFHKKLYRNNLNKFNSDFQRFENQNHKFKNFGFNVFGDPDKQISRGPTNSLFVPLRNLFQNQFRLAPEKTSKLEQCKTLLIQLNKQGDRIFPYPKGVAQRQECFLDGTKNSDTSRFLTFKKTEVNSGFRFTENQNRESVGPRERSFRGSQKDLNLLDSALFENITNLWVYEKNTCKNNSLVGISVSLIYDFIISQFSSLSKSISSLETKQFENETVKIFYLEKRLKEWAQNQAFPAIYLNSLAIHQPSHNLRLKPYLKTNNQAMGLLSYSQNSDIKTESQIFCDKIFKIMANLNFEKPKHYLFRRMRNPINLNKERDTVLNNLKYKYLFKISPSFKQIINHQSNPKVLISAPASGFESQIPKHSCRCVTPFEYGKTRPRCLFWDPCFINESFINETGANHFIEGVGQRHNWLVYKSANRNLFCSERNVSKLLTFKKTGAYSTNGVCFFTKRTPLLEGQSLMIRTFRTKRWAKKANQRLSSLAFLNFETTKIEFFGSLKIYAKRKFLEMWDYTRPNLNNKLLQAAGFFLFKDLRNPNSKIDHISNQKYHYTNLINGIFTVIKINKAYFISNKNICTFYKKAIKSLISYSFFNFSVDVFKDSKIKHSCRCATSFRYSKRGRASVQPRCLFKSLNKQGLLISKTNQKFFNADTFFTKSRKPKNSLNTENFLIWLGLNKNDEKTALVLPWKKFQLFINKSTLNKREKQASLEIVKFWWPNQNYHLHLSRLSKLIIEPQTNGNAEPLTRKRHKNMLSYAYATETMNHKKRGYYSIIPSKSVKYFESVGPREAPFTGSPKLSGHQTYLMALKNSNNIQSLSPKVSCFSYFNYASFVSLGIKLIRQKRSTPQPQIILQKIPKQIPLLVKTPIFYAAVRPPLRDPLKNTKESNDLKDNSQVRIINSQTSTMKAFYQQIFKWGRRGHIFHKLNFSFSKTNKIPYEFQNLKGNKTNAAARPFFLSKTNHSSSSISWTSKKLNANRLSSSRPWVYEKQESQTDFDFEMPYSRWEIQNQNYHPLISKLSKNPKQFNAFDSAYYADKNTFLLAPEKINFFGGPPNTIRVGRALKKTEANSRGFRFTENQNRESVGNPIKGASQEPTASIWQGNTNYYACISQITSWGSDHGSWILFLKYIRANIYKGDQLLPSYFNKMNFQMMPRTGSIMLQQLLSQLKLVPKSSNQNLKVNSISKQKSLSEIDKWQNLITNTTKNNNTNISKSINKTDQDFTINSPKFNYGLLKSKVQTNSGYSSKYELYAYKIKKPISHKRLRQIYQLNLPKLINNWYRLNNFFSYSQAELKALTFLPFFDDNKSSNGFNLGSTFFSSFDSSKFDKKSKTARKIQIKSKNQEVAQRDYTVSENNIFDTSTNVAFNPQHSIVEQKNKTDQKLGTSDFFLNDSMSCQIPLVSTDVRILKLIYSLIVSFQLQFFPINQRAKQYSNRSRDNKKLFKASLNFFQNNDGKSKRLISKLPKTFKNSQPLHSVSNVSGENINMNPTYKIFNTYYHIYSNQNNNLKRVVQRPKLWYSKSSIQDLLRVPQRHKKNFIIGNKTNLDPYHNSLLKNSLSIRSYSLTSKNISQKNSFKPWLLKNNNVSCLLSKISSIQKKKKNAVSPSESEQNYLGVAQQENFYFSNQKTKIYNLLIFPLEITTSRFLNFDFPITLSDFVGWESNNSFLKLPENYQHNAKKSLPFKTQKWSYIKPVNHLMSEIKPNQHSISNIDFSRSGDFKIGFDPFHPVGNLQQKKFTNNNYKNSLITESVGTQETSFLGSPKPVLPINVQTYEGQIKGEALFIKLKEIGNYNLLMKKKDTLFKTLILKMNSSLHPLIFPSSQASKLETFNTNKSSVWKADDGFNKLNHNRKFVGSVETSIPLCLTKFKEKCGPKKWNQDFIFKNMPLRDPSSLFGQFLNFSKTQACYSLREKKFRKNLSATRLEFFRIWLFLDSAHGSHLHWFNNLKNKIDTSLISQQLALSDMGQMRNCFKKNSFPKILQFYKYRKNFLLKKIFKQRIYLTQFNIWKPSILNQRSQIQLKSIKEKQYQNTGFKIAKSFKTGFEDNFTFRPFFEDSKSGTKQNCHAGFLSILWGRLLALFVVRSSRNKRSTYILLKRSINLFYDQEAKLDIKYEFKPFGPQIKHSSSYNHWKNLKSFKPQILDLQTSTMTYFRNQTRFRLLTVPQIFDFGGPSNKLVYSEANRNQNKPLNLIRKNKTPMNIFSPLFFSSSISTLKKKLVFPVFRTSQKQLFWGTNTIFDHGFKKFSSSGLNLENFYGPSLNFRKFSLNENTKPITTTNNDFSTIFHQKFEQFPTYSETFSNYNPPLSSETLFREENLKVSSSYKALLRKARILEDYLVSDSDPIDSKSTYLKILNGGLPRPVWWRSQSTILKTQLPLFLISFIFANKNKMSPDFYENKNLDFKQIEKSKNLSIESVGRRETSIPLCLTKFNEKCGRVSGYPQNTGAFTGSPNKSVFKFIWDGNQNKFKNLMSNENKSSEFFLAESKGSSLGDTVKLVSPKPTDSAYCADKFLLAPEKMSFSGGPTNTDAVGRAFKKTEADSKIKISEDTFSTRDWTKFENQTITNLNDDSKLAHLDQNEQSGNQNIIFEQKTKSNRFLNHEENVNKNPDLTFKGGRAAGKNNFRLPSDIVGNYKSSRRSNNFNYGRNLRKLRLQYLRNFRRLRFIEYLKATYIKPEWMILSLLPVLPPDLRPVIVNPRGYITGDINTHYQNVIYRNNNIEKLLDTFWIPRKFYSKTYFMNQQKATALMLSSIKSYRPLPYFYCVHYLPNYPKKLLKFKNQYSISEQFSKLASLPLTFEWKNEIPKTKTFVENNESLISFRRIYSITEKAKPINKSIRVLQNNIPLRDPFKSTNNLFYPAAGGRAAAPLGLKNNQKIHKPFNFLVNRLLSRCATPFNPILVSQIPQNNFRGRAAGSNFLHGMSINRESIVKNSFSTEKVLLDWKLERMISPMLSKLTIPLFDFNMPLPNILYPNKIVNRHNDQAGLREEFFITPSLRKTLLKEIISSKMQNTPKAFILSNQQWPKRYTQNEYNNFISKTNDLMVTPKTINFKLDLKNQFNPVSQSEIFKNLEESKIKKTACLDFYEPITYNIYYKYLFKLYNHKSFFGSNIGIATGYNKIVQTLQSKIVNNYSTSMFDSSSARNPYFINSQLEPRCYPDIVPKQAMLVFSRANQNRFLSAQHASRFLTFKKTEADSSFGRFQNQNLESVGPRETNFTGSPKDFNKDLEESIDLKNNSVPSLETKIISTQALHDSKPLQEMQYSLQKAVDALIDNSQKLQSNVLLRKGRPLKSLSDNLKGKEGRFRQHLLGKRVDYSGRSVIVVGPDLKLYECGIPLIMALRLFQPFLILYLIYRFKIASLLATQLIQRKHPMVINLLKKFIETWPILLNRAPTLHRMNIQAFKIRLVQGKAILLHPLVCSSYNADFDGDQMGVHVPITQQARAESWKLLWSINNSISIASRQPLFLPSQDMVIGNYYLTAPPIDNSIGHSDLRPLFKDSKSDINSISFSFLNSEWLGGFPKMNHYFFSLEEAYQYYLNTAYHFHVNTPVWFRFYMVFETSEREKPIEITIDKYGNSIYTTKYYEKQLKRNRILAKNTFYITSNLAFPISQHMSKTKVRLINTSILDNSLKKIANEKLHVFDNIDINQKMILPSKTIFNKNLSPILLNQIIRSTFGRIELYYEAFNALS